MDPIYEAQMRDLANSYKYLSGNPSLRTTPIGREAKAQLSSLDKTINPSGPNVPMIRALERLLDR